MWGFDEEMAKYSDEELNALWKKMWPTELFTYIMEKAAFNKSVEIVKTGLKRNVNNILSDELEETILEKRALSIVENTWLSFQIEKEDRAWENMDNALANFEFSWNIELPFSKSEKLDRFRHEIRKPENEIVWDFFVRTPAEYLKLLIYYVKVRSFEDMKRIITAFDKNKHKIMDFFYSDEYYNKNDMMHHCRESMSWFTEFMCWMSWKKIEWLLKKFKVSSIDDFNKLFIETPYMYPFLSKIDIWILEYVLDNYNITDTDWLIEMFKNEENRKISDLDFTDESWKNFIVLIKFFDIKSIDNIWKLMSSRNIIEILEKSSVNNFETLITCSNCKNTDEFENICSTEFIKKNIENTDYKYLLDIIDSLWIIWEEKNSLIYNIISTLYNRDFSFACDKFWKIISKYENLLNLKDFVISILLDWKNRIEMLKEFSELLEKHWNELKNCDFKRLIRLKEFMGWYITLYLAKEILLTDDFESLIKNWNNTIKWFKKWDFNHKNELHQNLEYKRFRKVVTHEKIQKYMRSHYTINDYFELFSNEINTNSNRLSERDKFEIECASYESKLLNDYIIQVKEIADRMWKKVLVIPNLSYWYLPVSPIYDSLSKQWVDFLIWAKVWSTECHNNTTVINSKLLKNHRTTIINEQPIIIVIDWTQHILDRNGWDWKSARYPDAYQWYLNQIIAINDSIEKDYADEDKRDMYYVWKSEDNMEWLRKNQDFQRTVNIYNELWDKKPKRLYNFAFWNTSWNELIIRSQREKAEKITPLNPKSIRWPTMVFCNIWVLDEQIPKQIKEKYKWQKHTPAYFDDSWRIVNFEFSHNKYGVNYINNLEDELKKSYWDQSESEHDIDKMATFIRYTSKHIWDAISEWE